MGDKRRLDLGGLEEIACKRQRVMTDEEEEVCNCCLAVHTPELSHAICHWQRPLFSVKKLDAYKTQEDAKRAMNFLAWKDLFEEKVMDLDFGEHVLKHPKRERNERDCLCCGARHSAGTHDLSRKEWEDRVRRYKMQGKDDLLGTLPGTAPEITDYYYVGKGAVHRKTPADERQCKEWLMRLESLTSIVTILKEDQDLGSLNEKVVRRSLYAGQHDSFKFRDRVNPHVNGARQDYFEGLLTLFKENECYLKKFILATLKFVQGQDYLLEKIRLVEVIIFILEDEETYPLDLDMLVLFCNNLSEYSSIRNYADRPASDVLMSAAHNLLFWLSTEDMGKLPNSVRKKLFGVVGDPTLAMLGYRNAPQPDVASLYNNIAKIHPDSVIRLEGCDRDLLKLVVSLNRSLDVSHLGPLSDLFFTVLARAAKTVSAPPRFVPKFVQYVLSTGYMPGPQGCVAILRLLDRWVHQLKDATQGLDLVRTLTCCLVESDATPTMAARALAYLLRSLHDTDDKHGWSTSISSTAQQAVKDLVTTNQCEAGESLDNLKFLLHCAQIMCRAARAMRQERRIDEVTGECFPEILSPAPDDIIGAMIGLGSKGRGAWLRLARSLNLSPYCEVVGSRLFCTLLSQLENLVP